MDHARSLDQSRGSRQRFLSDRSQQSKGVAFYRANTTADSPKALAVMNRKWATHIYEDLPRIAPTVFPVFLISSTVP
jgi:hypothetical protein